MSDKLQPIPQRDLHEVAYHPMSEKLTGILSAKIQNNNLHFFRVAIAYYLTKVASMMRCRVKAEGANGKSKLVNMFAVNLMPSGEGKGFTESIMEDPEGGIITPFRNSFVERTWPMCGEINLPKIANKRAIRKQCDPDEELERVQKEFDELGELAFSFSSGTKPAIRQFRHALLMAEAGSLNLEVDEIGTNLLGNKEVTDIFLELYDGQTKQSLVKNTKENKRSEEIHAKCPANMLLFGTPFSLFDGSKTEELFLSMLATGYSRRSWFSFSAKSQRLVPDNGYELQQILNQGSDDTYLDEVADKLESLADFANFNKTIQIPDALQLQILEYRVRLNKKAEKFSLKDDILRNEMQNRYFKVVSLAAVYAFVDGYSEMQEDHFWAAAKLAEDSAMSLSAMLSRERPHQKLAKYIAMVNADIAESELVEDLPYFNVAAPKRKDMLTHAVSWGYRNNIILKRHYIDGIEFFRGEALQETNLDEIRVAYSDHVAYDYTNETVPFDKLHQMTQAQGYHWISHHLKDGHRCEEKTLEGFNLVVIDVDGTCPLDTAKLLLEDYKALYYTTKRHGQDGEDRYRIILPMNYTLRLDAEDYREFMQGIFDWLPFAVDAQTGQRARKWLSHNGHYEYNDGVLLDVLPFIPKTRKSEERKEELMSQQSLSNLERWFIGNTGKGNRSNQMIRYALLLVDQGMDLGEVTEGVALLNQKLADPLSKEELESTIYKTVTRALMEREAA